MTKTYAQIVKQIEVLKADAEKVRRKEVQGVIDRIREAITVYSLTAEDLGFSARAKPGPKPGAAAKKRGRKAGGKTQLAVKYRNEAGEGWVGRGKRPQWLREALEKGAKLEDFLVK